MCNLPWAGNTLPEPGSRRGGHKGLHCAGVNPGNGEASCGRFLRTRTLKLPPQAFAWRSREGDSTRAGEPLVSGAEGRGRRKRTKAPLRGLDSRGTGKEAVRGKPAVSLHVLPPRSGTRQGHPLLPLLFCTALGVLARTGQEEEI